MYERSPTIYIEELTNLKKQIDQTRSLWVDRIIEKDNAIQNLWRIHTRCRNAVMRNYAVKVIKAIDMGVI